MTYFNSQEQSSNTQCPADVETDQAQSTGPVYDPVTRAKELLALHEAGMGIDYQQTKELALECAEEILEHWLPEGEQHGAQYVAYNPTRNDNELGSFTIHTGKGLWSDYADDKTGGDMISLIAYVAELKYQEQAAIQILEFIAGQDVNVAARMARSEAKAKAAATQDFTPIMPVPDNAPVGPMTHHKLGMASKRWEYRNELGQVMFAVLRFETPKGKTTRPQIYILNANGSTEWRFAAPLSPRIPYRLDRLAARPDAPVLFAEGEKSADAAQRLFPDFVAVTTMNGAQSPEKTDFKYFAGRKVFIAPDHDEAGVIYRNKLLRLLGDAGADVVGILRNEVFAAEDGTVAKGYDLADAERDGWTGERLAAVGDGLWAEVPAQQTSAPKTSKDSDTPGSVPEAQGSTDAEYSVGEYEVRNTGVFRPLKDKDGKIYDYIPFCSRIEVTALTRDLDSNNWGTEVKFTDPDGHTKKWTIAAELLAGSGESYRTSLLNMGVKIHPGGQNYFALASYLTQAAPAERGLSVRQPGWFRDVFVMPDRVYGQANERVVFQTNATEEINRFAPAGTLESWQQNVAAPCIGNSRAALSICVGLAPPLLALLGEDNGGFHLRGNSSSGKTVCLAIGSSVWGGSSLIRTWNATISGLEGVAVMHNDVLLPLDELGQASPIAASESAYMLGNGQGKSRADKTGEGRAVKRFRNLVLSSGEKGLADVMAQVGQSAMAGQEVRMVDIAADAGAGYGVFEDIHSAKTSQIFAETLKRATTEHHGHAGRTFVEVLANLELQPKLIETLRASIQRFLDLYVPAGADGQVGRVGRRFGLVAAAGELCIELGILPWPAGEATEASRKCFAAWIEQRGGTGTQEEAKAIAQVRRFIELHGESRFTSWNEGIDNNGTGKTINRMGFRRVMPDDRTEYIVLPENYRTELCPGMNPMALTKILMSNGLLAVNSAGKPQIDMRLPGLGKSKVYVIKPDIMGELVAQIEKEGDTKATASQSELAKKYRV